MSETVRTTCAYCGVGCGILARPRPDGSAEIAGDLEHPANFGRLCSKGAALGETLGLEGRLLHPMVHGTRVSWDNALNLVARRFADTIAEHGPDSVAFYVSGQCLTEDYYVANKLMKGFIGSANIDTNSRLCMASSVVGHKRAFGSDTVPGNYEDIDQADLVVLVGSNLAWCHPVLHQRLLAARAERGTRIVVIDPRATASCAEADLHLMLAPGSDVALFNGLLAHLADVDAIDDAYIAAHTSGFSAALAAARADDPATITGLSRAALEEFYRLFAATERVVTIYSQGVNQSSAGTDKVNAILNCHLATGRIGKPGMGPFSVTGQPNAMGGREVGGLATMLAAHMELGNGAHRHIVQNFWSAPRIAAAPGLTAVDLFRAVGDGRIKAIWIMATNPAVSLPEAQTVRSALALCPLVVVSDVVSHTDTAAFAHVLLPATAWGEKDGTVTNSERRISRQRAFLPAPGEARPDWWQICEVAKRMGFADAFSYAGPAAIFAEHATLSATGNNGTRDFDIGAYAAITAPEYDTLTPFQWPQPAGGGPRETRFFAEGGFFTPDRRARLLPVSARPPIDKPNDQAPLVLNTGRIRDQWHTMTRSGTAPRLAAHRAEPFLEIHPADAAARGLATADLCRAQTAHGTAILRVLITNAQPRGQVFVPMHWSSPFASQGGVGPLMAAHYDPFSHQPELKHTPVQVDRFAAAWHGFAVFARRPKSIPTAYWALARAQGGWRLELADQAVPGDWDSFAQALLGADGAETLAYHDATRGEHRYAAFAGVQFLGALFVAPRPVAVAREFLAGQISADVAPAARLRLLAGRAGAGEPQQGPIICACMGVGRIRIAAAIAAGHSSIAAVGAVTGAGTNCGSCRADIAAIIAAPIDPTGVLADAV